MLAHSFFHLFVKKSARGTDWQRKTSGGERRAGPRIGGDGKSKVRGENNLSQKRNEDHYAI